MPDCGSPGIAWNFEEKSFPQGFYMNYFGRKYFWNCGPRGRALCRLWNPPRPGLTAVGVTDRTDRDPGITRKASYYVWTQTDHTFITGQSPGLARNLISASHVRGWPHAPSVRTGPAPRKIDGSVSFAASFSATETELVGQVSAQVRGPLSPRRKCAGPGPRPSPGGRHPAK